MSLLQQLRARRRRLRMSQAEVAEAVGYSNPSAVSRVETEDMQPTLDKLERWAEALGCRLALVPLDEADTASDPPAVRMERMARELYALAREVEDAGGST